MQPAVTNAARPATDARARGATTPDATPPVGPTRAASLAAAATPRVRPSERALRDEHDVAGRERQVGDATVGDELDGDSVRALPARAHPAREQRAVLLGERGEPARGRDRLHDRHVLLVRE